MQPGQQERNFSRLNLGIIKVHTCVYFETVNGTLEEIMSYVMKLMLSCYMLHVLHVNMLNMLSNPLPWMHAEGE